MILFTGAHHARELVTTSMIVKIFLEGLHQLIHHSGVARYWNYNDMIILPVVNLDSYKFITDSYGTDEWETKKWKRKNMNKKFCKDKVVDSGVDLNRNYGFHYGETLEDIEECSETFRGNMAFSEKET